MLVYQRDARARRSATTEDVTTTSSKWSRSRGYAESESGLSWAVPEGGYLATGTPRSTSQGLTPAPIYRVTSRQYGGRSASCSTAHDSEPRTPRPWPRRDTWRCFKAEYPCAYCHADRPGLDRCPRRCRHVLGSSGQATPSWRFVYRLNGEVSGFQGFQRRNQDMRVGHLLLAIRPLCDAQTRLAITRKSGHL